MAKLTFSWTLSREEAKPNKTDLKNLSDQSFVFQLDFLQDVILEAQKLYDEALAASEASFHIMRLEKQDGTTTTH